MVDSGNEGGQYHAPPEIPALEIEKIYAWVTAPGASYRDYSSSRQETRDRFHRRLLLQRRLDAARARDKEAEIAKAGTLPQETGAEPLPNAVAESEEDARDVAQLPKAALDMEIANESVNEPIGRSADIRPPDESVASFPETPAETVSPAEEDHGPTPTIASSVQETPVLLISEETLAEEEIRVEEALLLRSTAPPSEDTRIKETGVEEAPPLEQIPETADENQEGIAEGDRPTTETVAEEETELPLGEAPEELNSVSTEDEEDDRNEPPHQPAGQPSQNIEPGFETGDQPEADAEPQPPFAETACEPSHATEGPESERSQSAPSRPADAEAEEVGAAVEAIQAEFKAASKAVRFEPEPAKESDSSAYEAVVQSVVQEETGEEHKEMRAAIDEADFHQNQVQEKQTPGPRWYALRSALRRPDEQIKVRTPPRLPILAVFSQAGGVGKTSVVGTLGRIFAARGEETFLAETVSPGFLPLFFGSGEQTSDQRPGEKLNIVRTFTPPAGSEDAVVRMLSLDPQQFSEPASAIAEALLWHARGSSRTLVDIQTGAKTVARNLAAIASTILVPLLPDMSSILTLDAIDAVFQKQGETRGRTQAASSEYDEPLYLLNQFDGGLPLHVEVRGLLQERLGARLLPFSLRREEEISEALAEGMTIVDYAPDSGLAGDFFLLADWLERIAPAPSSGLRALRWTEQ